MLAFGGGLCSLSTSSCKMCVYVIEHISWQSDQCQRRIVTSGSLPVVHESDVQHVELSEERICVGRRQLRRRSPTTNTSGNCSVKFDFLFSVLLKLKPNKAIDKNSSLSYGALPAVWNHTVICHPTQVNAPRLNPSQ